MSQSPLRRDVITPHGELLHCNREVDCSFTSLGLLHSVSPLFLKDDESACLLLNVGLLCASQMQILDKFPIEGGQKDPKKRIIPFLPGDS